MPVANRLAISHREAAARRQRAVDRHHAEGSGRSGSIDRERVGDCDAAGGSARGVRSADQAAGAQLEVWTPLSLSRNVKALTGVIKILNQLNLLHGIRSANTEHRAA
jgi:hypothetical protein